MLEAISEADGSQKDERDQLNSILKKHWPTDVKNILAALFSDSDPAIKNLAFSLLGVDGRPKNTPGGVRL